MTAVPAKSPCASCPYRCDVPPGVWAESEYAKLPLYDRPTWDQPPAAFYCHLQTGRLCAGWVGTHDMQESLGLRLACFEKMMPEEFVRVLDYVTAVPLFSTGAEAASHGRSGVTPTTQRMVKQLLRQAIPGMTEA